ncbi:hypothetical protein EDB89DRAFT_285153 [Lactarius sanguifluus]|nr:hypothetical protein EDB89DRAFT_285153 [Lactarius sanguifluus]
MPGNEDCDGSSSYESASRALALSSDWCVGLATRYMVILLLVGLITSGTSKSNQEVYGNDLSADMDAALPPLGVNLTGYRLFNMMTVFSFGITKGILTHGPINRTEDIGSGRRSAAGSCVIVILDQPIRTTKRKEMGTELIWRAGSVIAQSVPLEGSWEYYSPSAARSPSPHPAACLCFYFPTSTRMSLLMAWLGVYVSLTDCAHFLWHWVGCVNASKLADLTCPRRPDEFEHGSGWQRAMDFVVHHLQNNTVGTDSSLCLLGSIHNYCISFRAVRCGGSDSGVLLWDRLCLVAARRGLLLSYVGPKPRYETPRWVVHKLSQFLETGDT